MLHTFCKAQLHPHNILLAKYIYSIEEHIFVVIKMNHNCKIYINIAPYPICKNKDKSIFQFDMSEYL